MTPEEEKQRMIHIRIGNGTHKDLRKVAAEYDLTIQDIVADAVEDRIVDLEMEARIEKHRERLEKKARAIEAKLLERAERELEEHEKELIEREKELNISITAELDDEEEFVRELPEAVMAKLLAIENSIEQVSMKLDELLDVLNTDE